MNIINMKKKQNIKILLIINKLFDLKNNKQSI